MPAIQLARLRLEVANLITYFQHPDQFIKHMDVLLAFYSDRTRRPSLKGTPPPSLKGYSIPQPVFRQIVLELSQFAESEPESLLVLIDRCWQEPVVEYRRLAIHLLSKISPTPTDRILSRIRPWIEETIEETLIQEVFEVGLAPMREFFTPDFLELLEEWSESKDIDQQILNLIGLSTLLKLNSYDNFPILFKLIEPSFELEKTHFLQYQMDIFRQLAQLSKQETSHYLKELLNKFPNRETRWLIRNVLSVFHPEQQGEFKELLRKNRK